MVLRWWKERKILFKDYGNTIPFIYFGQLNAVNIALASYADISSGMDCMDCGFTLSRVTQEYDFSINNAPLIIAPLLKGEWQSFPSSRGEGGAVCLREGLIYILESAPFSRGVCLSFSVNKDAELSLLWKTLQPCAHMPHLGCLMFSPHLLCLNL